MILQRLIPLAAVSLALALAGCGPREEPPSQPDNASQIVNLTPPGTGNPPASGSTDAAAPASGSPAGAVVGPPVTDGTRVVIETSKGTIELELDLQKAPESVKNFQGYVKKGQYDGTIFHRVIPGFMVQGGGMTPDMQEKPTGSPIKNEGKNGLKNTRGTLAMARTGDPDSATAQFFINVADNSGLDYPQPDGFGYAVFGKVTKGMDVVDAIVAVPTTTKGGHENVPAEPVTIKSVKLP